MSFKSLGPSLVCDHVVPASEEARSKPWAPPTQMRAPSLETATPYRSSEIWSSWAGSSEVQTAPLVEVYRAPSSPAKNSVPSDGATSMLIRLLDGFRSIADQCSPESRVLASFPSPLAQACLKSAEKTIE